MKKHKGDIDQFIVPLIGIIALFVISIAALNYINSTNKYIAANQIARRYILKIESKGYLTGDNINNLKNDLSAEGFTNIDLTGTTLAPVSNGDDIFLIIQYDQVIKHVKVDGYNISFENETKRMKISRSSTAKD